jgi:hypothetical protein
MLLQSMRWQKVSKVMLIFSHPINANTYYFIQDPGSNDESTFYVTNIRDPVSRSISGFKCKNTE